LIVRVVGDTRVVADEGIRAKVQADDQRHHARQSRRGLPSSLSGNVWLRLAFEHTPVNEATRECARHGCDPEHPQLRNRPAADKDSRAGAPRRVDRSGSHGDADQMDQGERQTDREAREPDGCPAMGRTQYHDQKHERHNDFGDEASGQRVSARGMLAETIGGKAAELEVGFAARNHEQHASRNNGADDLRDDIGRDVAARKPPTRPQSNSHSWIEVPTRDRPQRVCAREDRQAEGERDTGEADSDVRKRTSQHRAAAST